MEKARVMKIGQSTPNTDSRSRTATVPWVGTVQAWQATSKGGYFQEKGVLWASSVPQR